MVFGTGWKARLEGVNVYLRTEVRLKSCQRHHLQQIRDRPLAHATHRDNTERGILPPEIESEPPRSVHSLVQVVGCRGATQRSTGGARPAGSLHAHGAAGYEEEEARLAGGLSPWM